MYIEDTLEQMRSDISQLQFRNQVTEDKLEEVISELETTKKTLAELQEIQRNKLKSQEKVEKELSNRKFGTFAASATGTTVELEIGAGNGKSSETGKPCFVVHDSDSEEEVIRKPKHAKMSADFKDYGAEGRLEHRGNAGSQNEPKRMKIVDPHKDRNRMNLGRPGLDKVGNKGYTRQNVDPQVSNLKHKFESSTDRGYQRNPNCHRGDESGSSCCSRNPYNEQAASFNPVRRLHTDFTGCPPFKKKCGLNTEIRNCCNTDVKVNPEPRSSTPSSKIVQDTTAKVTKQVMDDLLKNRCNICGNMCRTKQGLERHQLSHRTNINTNKSQYKCFCGANFSTRSLLLGHKTKYHNGQHRFDPEKTFQCKSCDMSFRRNHDLVYHERIHSGNRPYECGQCQKSFTKMSYLSDHLKKHLMMRPSCPGCDRRFQNTELLRIHRKRPCER